MAQGGFRSVFPPVVETRDCLVRTLIAISSPISSDKEKRHWKAGEGAVARWWLLTDPFYNAQHQLKKRGGRCRCRMCAVVHVRSHSRYKDKVESDSASQPMSKLRPIQPHKSKYRRQNETDAAGANPFRSYLFSGLPNSPLLTELLHIHFACSSE